MRLLNYFMRGISRLYPFKKGYHYVLSFCMKYVSGLEIGTDIFGNHFLLDLDNYIDARIFIEGQYESADVHRLIKLAKGRKSSIFLDIGANIGVYTILVAKELDITTFAFEPDPVNFTQLMSNIYLNRLSTRVTPYNIALSDKSGKASLYISVEPKSFDHYKHNSGTNSLIENSERHDQHIEVETKILDDMLSFNNHNILVKIDVEGFESTVLRGMTRLLTHNDCLIQIEIFRENLDNINSVFSNLGYSLYEKGCGNNYFYTKTSLYDYS